MSVNVEKEFLYACLFLSFMAAVVAAVFRYS